MKDLTRRQFLAATGAGLATLPGLAPRAGALAAPAASRSGDAGTSSSTRLTAFWWGGTQRDAITEEVFKITNQKYPNVSLSGQFLAFGDYWTKFNTLAAASNLPDILQMNGYISQYGKRGLLLDLKPLMKRINLGDYDRSLLKTGMVGSHLYGINFGQQYVTTFYDTAVVERSGAKLPSNNASWDEWGKFATDVWKATKVHGLTDGSGNDNVWTAFLQGRGKSGYTASGKLGFNKADALAFFQYWADLRAAGGIGPGPQNQAYINSGQVADDPVIKGESAMTQQPIVLFTSYQTLMKDTLGMASVPIGPKGRGEVNPFFGWSVSATTKHKEAAAEFLHTWFTNRDALKAEGLDRAIPASPTGLKLVSDSATPAQKTELQFLNRYHYKGATQPNGSVTAGQKIANAFRECSQDISLGGMSVQAAVSKFMAAAQAAVGT